MKVAAAELKPGDLVHVAPDGTLTLLMRDGEQMCCTTDPEPIPNT